MADQYSVGNILLELEAVAKDQLSGLTQATTTLERLSKPLKQISKINLDSFSNSFKTLSNINFDNLTKGLDSIKDLSKKNFSGITSINNNLQRLGTLDLSLVTSNLQKIGTLDFTQLSQAMQSIGGFDISAVNSVSKLLNSINKLQNLNLNKIDFSALKLQFIQLADSVDPFLQKLDASSASLQNFSNAINVGKVSNEMDKTSKKSKSFFSAFSKGINRFQVFLNYSKRLKDNLVSITSSAIDFNETLNKFQVSMGSYYTRALEFVNKLTNAFNLSSESIMNYQSTFKNMLSSLGGLAEETSYQLSETLTRMAIDYSSLFNVSIDTAMQQFQSVLSGQTKSIRSTAGYDITETTLYATYQKLGGTKTMRQLDQVEKRLLRIIALQEQMQNTSAVNDYANTIDNTANVLKQIGETIKEMGTYIGQVLLIKLESTFNTILGVSIALKEMAKSFAISKGYTYEIQGALIDTSESINEATESAEELKRVLLGFDQINILGSTTTTTSGTDYSFLTDAINSNYGTSLDEISSKAHKIADEILNWLGFTEEVIVQTDKLGNKIEVTQLKLKDDSNLNRIINRLKTILSLSTAIFASISIGKLLTPSPEEIKNFVETISRIKKIISIALSPTMLLIGSLIALFTLLYTKNENFKKSVDKLLSSIMKLFEPIFNAISEIVDIIEPIFEEIIATLGDSLAPIIDNIAEIIEDILPIIKLVSSIVSTIMILLAKLEKNRLPKIQESFKFILNIVQAITQVIGIITKTISNLFKYVINGLNKVLNFFGIGTRKQAETIDWNLDFDFSYFKFAKGGVVSKPTMALVGEYQGASSNPEIISPESKMKDIFTESMLPFIQIMVRSNKEIVNAIDESNSKPISINGKKVSESIYNDLVSTMRRKGKTLMVS